MSTLEIQSNMDQAINGGKAGNETDDHGDESEDEKTSSSSYRNTNSEEEEKPPKPHELQFTQDHVSHLILSIIFSPITWLWIALLGESPTYIIPTIITTSIMFVVGGLTALFRNVGFEGFIKRKIPFGIADGGWFGIPFKTFAAQLFLNVALWIEMTRIYISSQKNIVYQCYDQHFDEGMTSPPNQCMVYLDLLGNAYVVFFSSIYINVACIRTVKQKRWDVYNPKIQLDEEENLDEDIGLIEEKLNKLSDEDEEMEEQERKQKKDTLCKQYSEKSNQARQKRYKKMGFDKEMVGILEKYHKRKDTAIIQRILTKGKGEAAKKMEKDIQGEINELEKFFEEIRKLLIRPVNKAGFGISWFGRHCKDIEKKLAAFVQAFVLFLLVWGFGVSFAVSSCYVYSNQFYDKISNQPAQLITIIPSSLICMVAVQMLCSTLYKISSIYEKAYDAMKLCENFLCDNDEELDISLIKIESWYDFRNYVLDNILPLVYEITTPIISLLIVSVIVFSFAFIYQLTFIFEGSTELFFQSILADNVRFIAFGFTVLLIIASMLIFPWVLHPFREQQAHLDLIKVRKTWLLFDQQQNLIEIEMNKNGDLDEVLKIKSQKLKSNIEICKHLIDEMKEFGGAPVVLGFELNETKLLAIRGYIISVIAIFAGTVWGDYITKYDGLLT